MMQSLLKKLEHSGNYSQNVCRIINLRYTIMKVPKIYRDCWVMRALRHRLAVGYSIKPL
jgi:hypothetical protein